MSYRVKEAIEAINSSAKFMIEGDSVDNITWLEGTTPIAKSDIEAKMTALSSSKGGVALRFERNLRLANCDWTRMDDTGLSTSKKNEWATYRQALRDLPASANPTVNIDGELNLSSVTWPTEPS